MPDTRDKAKEVRADPPRSGTKPLHDLISNIQKSKTEKEDLRAVKTAA